MDSVNLTGGAGQSVTAEELNRLREFRGQMYRCLGRRADELFELTDALLCAEGPVQSLVGLCLAPEHRRGHGALYDALTSGEVHADRLRAELAALPMPRMFGGRIVLPSTGRRGCVRTRRPARIGCSATSTGGAVAGTPISGSRAGPTRWWPRWRPGRPVGPRCWMWCGCTRPTTPPRSPPPSCARSWAGCARP